MHVKLKAIRVASHQSLTQPVIFCALARSLSAKLRRTFKRRCTTRSIGSHQSLYAYIYIHPTSSQAQSNIIITAFAARGRPPGTSERKGARGWREIKRAGRKISRSQIYCLPCAERDRIWTTSREWKVRKGNGNDESSRGFLRMGSVICRESCGVAEV